MLHIVLAIALTAHLLLVDIAMAAPLVCVWLERRETRLADQVAGRIGCSLAKLATWALGGGALLGVLLLALRWQMADEAYFSALAAIPASRLWFGLAELLFSGACMAAYCALWNRWRAWRLAHRLLAIAAGSNLLAHFPALFAIVSILTARGQWIAGTLDRTAYQQLLFDPEVVSRVVHVWLAAFAVTGAAVMAIAKRISVEQEHDGARCLLIRRGALVALVPTLAQFPAGLWLALELPEEARQNLFGGDWVASSLFLVSVALALQLTHTLAAVALGDSQPKQIHRSTAVLVLLVLCMVAARLAIGH